MQKITGFFRLIRFELPFAAGVCVIMGQLLALGEFASILVSLFAFLSVFFISGSILVLNDYFDVETDKINAPGRPIPANIVSKTEALVLAITLVFSGIFLSYLLGSVTFVFAILLLIIGFLYNRKFKKTGLAGNLMVSFSVGMTFIYGAVSVELAFNKVAWVFALIAALVDLGEEIAADAMDMQGDKLINSTSIAIIHGKHNALRISSVIFTSVIILSIVPFLFGWFKIIYLIPIVIMDAFIAYNTFRLFNTDDPARRKHIRWIYLGATFGLVIFIIMRFLGF